MTIKQIPAEAVADFEETKYGRYYERLIIPTVPLSSRPYFARFDRATGDWFVRYKNGKKWHPASIDN